MNLKNIIAAASIALLASSGPTRSGIIPEYVPKPDCFNAYMMGGSIPWTTTYWLHLEDIDGDRKYDTEDIIGPESVIKEKLRNIIPSEDFLHKWFYRETRPYCKRIENIG